MKRCIPYIVIGIVSLLLLVRCFYSFSWSDESFYLTVAHRFWLGERIIADEWYTTQLSTPLLLPFYALFQWFTGGNEGVYLYFRLLYWLISTLSAFFTYFILKKNNSVMASLICALLYFTYSRANIGGMSYYNMTLTCVLVAVLLIYEQIFLKRFVGWKLYFTGILLAAAVVNTPFLALMYLLTGAILFLNKKCRVYWKELLWTVAGTLTAAVLYMGYVLSKVSIGEMLLNIPHILNEPEIQSTNPFLVIPLIFLRIAWRYRWTIGLYIVSVFYMLLKRRKRIQLSEKEIHGLLTVDMLVFLINVWLSWGLIGCINIAGTLFLGLFLLLSGKWEKIDKGVLGVFGVAGFSISIGFSFSSDTGLDAMTIGFVLIVMGSILLAFKQQRFRKLIAAVAWIMVLQTMTLRLFSVYRDAPLSELKTPLEAGPAKYLLTTEAHAGQYDALRAAIEQYVREDDIVFYSKWCFWSYLCTNNSYGAPSSWRMPLDSPRLEEYYDLNPEKIPTCIFVLNPSYGDFESSLIQGNEKADYPNENREEGYLTDYIREHDYEVIELDCATIYRSKKTFR